MVRLTQRSTIDCLAKLSDFKEIGPVVIITKLIQTESVVSRAKEFGKIPKFILTVSTKVRKNG